MPLTLTFATPTSLLPKAALHRSVCTTTPIRCCTTQTRRPTALHTELLNALKYVNRGLDIDADETTESATEARVEDAIESLESTFDVAKPTSSPSRFGTWEFAYSSSAMTRYTGGLTGMQRFFPGGIVGAIILQVDEDEGTWLFRESIAYEIFGQEFDVEMEVEGPVRALNDTREVWTPKKVRFYGLRFWAESWKSLRAFANTNVTYVDDYVKICRGPTGAAVVFVRSQLAIDSD